jgi:hypothetical protein
MGPSSKTSVKVGKAASNGISKHANRSISAVCFSYFIYIFWNSLWRLIIYGLGFIRESYQWKGQSQSQLCLFRTELFSHKHYWMSRTQTR